MCLVKEINNVLFNILKVPLTYLTLCLRVQGHSSSVQGHSSSLKGFKCLVDRRGLACEHFTLK